MRIAVAGGTGMVGAMLVSRLESRGDDVEVLARSAGVDVVSDTRLAARLDGVEAIVDTLSVGTTRAKVATPFFERTSQRLLEAGREVGVRHHVVLSIVGIDRMAGFGYYRGKLAQESVVRRSGSAYTILRATQFHEFAGQLLERGRVGPLAVVPRMLVAPVAADEVAAALAELATAEPRNATLELAGPAEERVHLMARRLVRHLGSRTPVLGVPLPGPAGRAMRTGALLSADPWRVGSQRFEDWLAEQPGDGRR